MPIYRCTLPVWIPSPAKYCKFHFDSLHTTRQHGIHFTDLFALRNRFEKIGWFFSDYRFFFFFCTVQFQFLTTFRIWYNICLFVIFSVTVFTTRIFNPCVFDGFFPCCNTFGNTENNFASLNQYALDFINGRSYFNIWDAQVGSKNKNSSTDTFLYIL